MTSGQENSEESPESRILPYEDLNTKQARITGEKFPALYLGVCDSCHWCYTSENERGIIEKCPICGKPVSQIPMSIDEVCLIEFDKTRGLTVRFERRLPLR